MVEITDESVPNAQQLVGQITTHSYADSRLEPLPEAFNITRHMITSRNNWQLKIIRRLKRSKGEDALLEGPHLIQEAVTAGLSLRSVLATNEFLASPAGRRLAPYLPIRPLEIERRLLEEVADSDSPRGIVAVAHLARPRAQDLPQDPNGTYLYAEGLQDPGNLGAVVRAAEGSGATAVCLSPGSVHPNHPRALRASAGSLLRLPVAVDDAERLADHLQPLRPTWAALIPRGGQDVFQTSIDGCRILALGAEGSGLTSETHRRADIELTIPLEAPVESLNAAVAAAITLFQLRRPTQP